MNLSDSGMASDISGYQHIAGANKLYSASILALPFGLKLEHSSQIERDTTAMKNFSKSKCI